MSAPTSLHDTGQPNTGTQPPSAGVVDPSASSGHVALDTPFRWTLREGAKGVQLAELGLKSWAERRWLDVPAL